MTNMRRLGASVAALALMIGGGLAAGTALADDTTTPETTTLDLTKAQPITVQVSSDDTAASLSGHTFVAVPLATYSKAYGVTTGDDQHVTSYDVTTNADLTDAIKTSIDAVNSTADVEANNPMAWVVANLLDSQSSPWAGQLRTFLDKLDTQDAFTTAKGAGTSLTVAADGKSATANVKPGIYAVVDTTTSGQAAIIAMNGTGIQGLTKLQGTAEGSPEYTLGTVDYKVHSTTITKTVSETGRDAHSETNDANTAVSSMIGKAIPFTLTSTVPNWTGYTKYYYGISDSYTKGLTINEDSVVVTVNGETLTKGTDYTVTNTAATENTNGTLSIVFGNKGDIIPSQAKFPVNAAVTVTYTATLNGNAVTGTAETNTATIEYSRNPNTWTDHEKTPESKDTVYTGSVDIAKQDMDGNALRGAEFTATDATGTATDAIKFVRTSDGRYRVATNDDTGTTETLAVDSNGTLHIEGIAKSFKLRETKSPYSGAYLPEATVNAEVNPTTGAVTTTITAADKNKMIAMGAEANANKVIVQNARSLFQMPKTGATWMTIFVGGIAVLLAAGAVLIVVGRKKESAR